MPTKNSNQNSSPVTRPLHGARVSSKALSRTAASKSTQRGQRSLAIPNPARPAHASKGSAHIVSFAEAKRSNAVARPLSPSSQPSAQRPANVSAPKASRSLSKSETVRQSMPARPKTISGSHASHDMAKKTKGGKRSKAEKSAKKKVKLLQIPLLKKRDKEFQIPSGVDLTTDSSNVFRNMDAPSRAMEGNRSRGIEGKKALAAKRPKAPSPNASNAQSDSDAAPEKGKMAAILENRKERAQDKKRKKAKAKADKKFDKAYGAAEKSPAASQGAPRAALYSTKMGSTHKKSAKMQIRDAHDMATQSLGFIGDKISGFTPPKLPKFVTRLAMTAVVFAVLGFGLYSPAQQYYIQMRETDRLQAEYVEVAERTNNLAASIDSLHTTEGIEDKAHADLGYVKTGEKSATVKGIATINLLKLPTSNVAPGSIPAPDTWYSGTLDVLFGYTG